MLTSAKNVAVKFRDEREIYRCTRKRHASGRGSPPGQPSQLLRLHSLRSADIHNTPSNLCGGESSMRSPDCRTQQLNEKSYILTKNDSRNKEKTRSRKVLAGKELLTKINKICWMYSQCRKHNFLQW